jgi:type I restriction enzyme S subunit
LLESRDGEWGEGSEKIGHQSCEIIRGTDFANLNDQNIELPRRWIPDHLVERKKLQIGDIVFEMAGGTAKQSTGRSAILNDRFFEQHKDAPVLCASFCRHLRLDKEKFNPQFIYFMLQALYRAGYMSVYNIQHTGVSRFQYTSFKKMTVLNIPSLTEQKKIAAVLSAYDDLIENNQRRIALLEKMAEEIYREWFVRMRFPGYEQVKFEKGIPQGWRQKSSAEIFDVLSGGTPKTDVPIFWDGEIPFFTPRDASENFYVLSTEKSITSKGLSTCNSRLYRKNTIFITARGTVGKLALAQCDMAMNQSCYALLPKDGGGIYFYFLSMKNAISYIKGVSKSGVFDNIVVDTFRIVPILMPHKNVVDKFNALIEPIFTKTANLLLENKILSSKRDKLLPRLISGKLSVEHLEIHFPPSMRESGHDQ